MSRDEDIPPEEPSADRVPQRSTSMSRMFEMLSNMLGGGRSRGSQPHIRKGIPVCSQREDHDAAERSEEHTPVWRQVPQALDTVSQGRCLILGNPSVPESIVIAATLSEGGYDVDLCNDADAVLASLISTSDRSAWSLFVVDLDFLQGHGDLEDCVDDLMHLRSERCDLPLILVSFDFARDDFDENRLPIADASLRAPVLGPRILYAARIATANNRVWQARCADMTPRVS